MIQCNDVPEQPVIDYLVDYVYLIEKSGRKWLTGRLDRPGKRPLLDKIRCCKVIQRADGYGFSTVATRKEMCDSGSHKAGNASRSSLYLPGMNAEVSRTI